MSRETLKSFAHILEELGYILRQVIARQDQEGIRKRSAKAFIWQAHLLDLQISAANSKDS